MIAFADPNTGDFNPRSPWGERRIPAKKRLKSLPFQSTLPVGGATRGPDSGQRTVVISIHAPRGGSDLQRHLHFRGGQGFQSTLPVGGATSAAGMTQAAFAISIHAPRGGSDHPGGCRKGRVFISIHAPRGGSDSASRPACFAPRLFQSTLPVGGATAHGLQILPPAAEISIHAPRGGSDTQCVV